MAENSRVKMMRPLIPAMVATQCGYLLLSLVILAVSKGAISGDAEALLSLKYSIDPLHSLHWDRESTDAVCSWEGIKECIDGRVTKLVLERLNLTGTLTGKSLNQLDQLRVLSFKGNSLSGPVPDLSSLVNLKSLYLADNNFSGGFPASLTGHHRLKVIVLANNRMSGPIPDSLLRLSRLYVLYLQDNQFTGPIPPLNQTSLRFFNVSNNNLSGEIPATSALVRFNASSFSGNGIGLCGEQVGRSCNSAPAAGPEMPAARHKHSKRRVKIVAAASAGGFALVCLCVVLIFCLLRRRRTGGVVKEREIGPEGGPSGPGGPVKEGGFSWDGEGVGALVCVGPDDQQMRYSLDDLLKASAETLGRGPMGSTYKAVLESGFIVTVKRLKDARNPRVEEFRRHMEVIGRLRHPNLVPLRAYFQAKEERLLVYDYFPNGSLFTLLHGTRTSSSGKPLHWTSCLKIAEDLATALLYIHQNPGLVHGNLKSSNVLLGPDFESCLTDYGLCMFHDPGSSEEPSASSLFYRAPENRDTRRPPTQQSDVYSFGVLLLELLTGKTPYQDLVLEHGSDIPTWVRSVREEETDSGEDPASGNEAGEEKLQALVNIAMACVTHTPENRPTTKEVLKMIRDARGETHVSSNSSDHSPGRWSDTIHSLPREEHLSI